MNIQFFIEQNPVKINEAITLSVGYYAEDYSLNDVTENCTLVLALGNATQVDYNTWIPNDIGSLIFIAVYTDVNGNEYQTELSLYAIQLELSPTAEQLKNVFASLLPQGVYNTQKGHKANDMMAHAMVIAKVYPAISQIRQNTFALLTNDYNDWNFQLGQQYNNNSNQVLQLWNNLRFQQLTPYAISLTLTKFIYLISGQIVPVAVVESELINVTGIWAIGIQGKTEIGQTTTYKNSQVQLNVSYQIFDNGILTVAQQNSIIKLINCISRIESLNIQFGLNFTNSGYINYIGETYPTDPRNHAPTAYIYEPNSPFYQVVAYTRKSLSNIVSIQVITPVSGNLIHGTIIPLQIIGTNPDGSTQDVTIYCNYIKTPPDSPLVTILPGLLIVGQNTGTLNVQFLLQNNPQKTTTVNWSVV